MNRSDFLNSIESFAPEAIKRFMQKITIPDASVDIFEACWNFSSMGFNIANFSIIPPRYAFALFKNNRVFPSKVYKVCHTCDRGICVNPAHLFLGTHKDNSDDKVSKNRQHKNKPRYNPHSNLNCDKVLEIRTYLAKGMHTQAEIAAIFNVSRQTIGSIKQNVYCKYAVAPKSIEPDNATNGTAHPANQLIVNEDC